jgi:hypothetical protein
VKLQLALAQYFVFVFFVNLINNLLVVTDLILEVLVLLQGMLESLVGLILVLLDASVHEYIVLARLTVHTQENGVDVYNFEVVICIVILDKFVVCLHSSLLLSSKT